MIAAAYESAKGKTFTWSPSRQVFTDEQDCTAYNYAAMLWLKHHGVLKQLPWNSTIIVHQFRIEEN